MTAGAAYRTLTTGADGGYTFTPLDAGDYCVRVDEATLPVSVILTTNHPALDVTLAAGQYFANADFGYGATLADDRLAVGAYAPCTDATWLQQLAQAHQATIVSASASACGYTLQVPPAELAALQAAIVADAHARHAAPDALARGDFTPNDPDYSNVMRVYGPQRINAPAAWDVTTGDPKVRVAIVDTGITGSHPEFAGRLLAGYDFVNQDADATDDNGHGTHVAGIAAAGLNNGVGLAGLAGDATLLPVKVLGANNVGWWSDVAHGLTWAVDQGARVLNLSVSGTQDSQVLRDAVAYANSKGALVVVAAGNDGTGQVAYPASFANVLAVGATGYEGVRMSYSNFGPNVDVMAPGDTIWSTYLSGGYTFMSGTSMAAPHATGVAALLYSVDPNLTAARAKELLQSTATDLGDPGVDLLNGYGQINAGAAVAALAPAVYVTPTTGLTAPLAVDVNGNGLVDPGDTLRYVVTVANSGATPLSGVVVSATVPVNTSYVISSTRLGGIPVRDDTAPQPAFPLDGGGLNIGTVAPHGSSLVSFDVVVGQLPRGTYTVVGRSSVVAEAGSQELQAVTPIAGTLLQAAVSPASAQISQTLTYTLTSAYLSSGLLSSVVVTAAVPAGTSYVAGSANAGGVQNGGVVKWNLGTNIAGVLGFTPAVPSAIAVNSTTAGAASSGNTMSIAHTTAGSNRLMLAEVSIALPSSVIQITGVTYAGQSLTRLGFAQIAPGDNGGRVELWALVNPPGGTADVVVTLDGDTSHVVAGVTTFTGVNQTLPYGFFYFNTVVADNISLVTPSAAGELVVDAIAYNRKSDAYAPNSGQAQLWKRRQTDICGGASSRPGAPLVTMGWTGDNARAWAIGAVSIKPFINPSLGNVLSAAPTLVTAGSRITVTQVLTASQDIANVTPSALTITATNGVTATRVSGPTPARATVGITGTTFTWVYQVTGSNIGQLTFGGRATGGSYSWPWAQTNSVSVHPPLTFQATVTGAPPGGGAIRTTGFITDAGGRLPSPASNTPTTGLYGAISGCVWEDRDGDGAAAVGEPGIIGVTLALSGPGGQVTTAHTDADGHYRFSELASGVYTVTVAAASVPAQFEVLTTRYPLVVTLQDGEDYNTADVGFRARVATLGGSFWYDTDADGHQDLGEPGLGNVTVDLWLDDGDGVLETAAGLGSDFYAGAAVSTATGAYRLDTRGAGHYFVDVSDHNRILLDLAHTLGPQSLQDPTPAIAIAEGQAYEAADFGYVRAPAAGQAIVGDLVWLDGDGDGVRALTEPVAIGYAVCATPAGGGAVQCATTDLNGRYLLEVPAGAYQVALPAPPLGLSATTAPTQAVTVSAGQQDLHADFGFRAGATALGTLGGIVWEDLPVAEQVDGIYDPLGEPGIPAVTVDAIEDLNADGQWDGGEPYVAAASGFDGEYRFNGLLGGHYLLRVSDTWQVLRWFAPTRAATAGNAWADGVSKAQPYAINLPAGGSDLTADFGYRAYDAFGVGPQPGPGVIGDQLWFDLAGDGVYAPEAGDLPLPGVTVALRQGGTLVATATTGSDGQYLFSGLAVGVSYEVAVTDQFGGLADYLPTVTGFDSHPQPYTVSLTTGTAVGSADFGYAQTAGVGSLVWIDANANGLPDENPLRGLDGIGLTVYDAAGSVVTQTVTGNGGAYTITGLFPGAYTVQVTTRHAALAPTTAETREVTLTSGAFDESLAFGYAVPSGLAFRDLRAEASRTAVQLMWQFQVAADMEPPTFDLERAVAGAENWERVTSAPVSAASHAGDVWTYSYTDTPVTPDTTYLYQLKLVEDGTRYGPVTVEPAAQPVRLLLPLVSRP